jgi:hypothetical protein
MNFSKRISFVLCVLFVISCSQKLDFSQIEDYIASPIYTSSLTYFKVTPGNFIDAATGNEIELPADISDFRVFENEFIRKYLVKAVFNVEIKNELDRDITLQFNILDDTNNPVYQFEQLNITANTLDFIYEETLEISTNENILNATRISIKINLSPSITSLDINDTSEFEFKSAVTLFIETN